MIKKAQSPFSSDQVQAQRRLSNSWPMASSVCRSYQPDLKALATIPSSLIWLPSLPLPRILISSYHSNGTLRHEVCKRLLPDCVKTVLRSQDQSYSHRHLCDSGIQDALCKNVNIANHLVRVGNQVHSPCLRFPLSVASCRHDTLSCLDSNNKAV